MGRRPSLGTEFGADSKMGLVSRMIFTIFQGINARSVHTGTNAILDAVVARGKETHGSYLSDWTIQPYVHPSLPTPTPRLIIEQISLHILHD